MYEKFILWLLLTPILVSITSCIDRPQIQTNSECFLPDLSVLMWQSDEDLNLDSSIFKDYEEDEDYATFTHSDSIFESNVTIYYDWNWNTDAVFIHRKKTIKNDEKIDIEENLNYIKNIWLNCNIPTDTIDMQLENITKLIENDSLGVKYKFYSVNISSKLKEMYSWGYGKRKEDGHNILGIGYCVY